MDKIAKRIEDCRHGKNISQSELARKVGVTPQAVQKWEKAKTVPRGATLRRLADVLEVTLTDGSDVLYTGTLAGLTRSTAATAPAVLAVGQARTMQASFHCPENTGNTAQQTRMSFVLCADAVQTKNNPTGLFD